MTSRRANELLYDSEATLRLVDHELSELRAHDADRQQAGAAVAMLSTTPSSSAPAAAAPAAMPASAVPHLRADASAAEQLPEVMAQVAVNPGLSSLPEILQRASGEILSVLESLRHSRSALEAATVEKIQHTHEKLREVTSATEVAATDILDSLDRAQTHLDALDALDVDPTPASRERGAAIRNTLREEVFGMMGALQFQDITTQQLSYASSVLTDMESRLQEIARLFDLRVSPAAAVAQGAASVPPGDADSQVFAPDATIAGAEVRQALADQIFVGGVRRSA